MRVLKRSTRASAKLSIVLLDWSVRESFHFLHYLERQTAGRDEFEVVVVEYYARQSPALRPFLGTVDTWVLLEMPESCCYHKHLMYNAGIVFSKGDVLVFCDSDAMVRETFLASIQERFDRDPEIVLHLDEFRNLRRDFYPFNFPSFDDVMGAGCVNNSNGRTNGLASTADPLHQRNYGACMCVRRLDALAIGGADEHVDYLGHISGPYEMAFRLWNTGRRGVWHETEFLYHTWHPGQAGERNYAGPHDGRHMSTTALEALVTRRRVPYVQNRAVRMLQDGVIGHDALEASLIDPDRARAWALGPRWNSESRDGRGDTDKTQLYKGFRIDSRDGHVAAQLLMADLSRRGPAFREQQFRGATLAAVKDAIDSATGGAVGLMAAFGMLLVLTTNVLVSGWQFAAETLGRGAMKSKALPLARLRHRGSIDRVRRLVTEMRWLSASLTALVVNLSAWELRGRQEADDPIVIVDARTWALYLRWLGALRMLPPIRLLTLDSPADIDSLVTKEAQRAAAAPVVVSRTVYFKHYPSFSGCPEVRIV